MIILKFGWTSLKDIAMIHKSANIIIEKRRKYKTIVVVSAMSWVDNILIKLCELAWKGEIKKVSKTINSLFKKHKEIANNLCSGNCDISFLDILDGYILELLDIFKWMSISKTISSKWKAKVLYFWEILSSFLLSIAIEGLWYKSRMCFSKEILSCYWNFMDWECNYKLSEKKLNIFRKQINFSKEIPIITWFWGWDDEWNVYLFNRWGSDYVATLIGTLLKVKKVEIRTDVDWVYSADPKIVKNPILWNKLDYDIASEFSLVWDKVLHPKTIFPAKKNQIEIVIKNTHFPENKWTSIFKVKDFWVKGVNVDIKQVIFTFIDPAMMGDYGYISDILKIFKKNKVSIDTIATTETSFSISMRKKYCKKALIEELNNLEKSFTLKIYKNISKISIIWRWIDNSKILSYFEKIIMISSWAYGKTLTVFIKSSNPTKLIRSLHEKIFNS